MGLSLHCISECQNTTVLLLRQLSIIQKPLILSMELEKIRRIQNKLTESEKNYEY